MGEILEFGPKKEKRCYVIADDYRWHVLTDSFAEYCNYVDSYLNLMNQSKKENHYYFKNIFLDENEYQATKKLIDQKIENTQKINRPKRHLELIVD